MATTNKAAADTATAKELSTKPKRVFFPPASSEPEEPESVPLPAEPVATAPSPQPTTTPARKVPGAESSSARPAAATPIGAVGKKRGPKPSAEPLEHLTVKVKSEYVQKIDSMMEDAPRHVLKQDLVDFMLADFFRRHQTLPAALLAKPKPEKKPTR
ncbi:hypothetical protein [Hymenobacter guriensis]|uniref:DUF3408 domain-containing protein n=1 Tax=Hymenobacter guriensis TaxID=2793065 RepID=A0ABS0L845_9BACT|nr:hypothetical protein [Hymenobacter guriensis]MBG8556295.1 hypothetical protein [Hymenobacter guriensis]